MKNIRIRIIQKIHDKSGHFLNSTKAARKDERRQRKLERRAKRLQQLRNFKPFDLGCLRWLQQRHNKRNKITVLDVSGPLPE